MIYHVRSTWLPGGFLGVDLFFVVSGYLITSGLLRERAGRATSVLGAFWVRRAKRLLPAALLLIVMVLAATEAWLAPEVRAVRAAALASGAYITNWYFIVFHQPYFETVGRPMPLQHLWSLAVEEQFYLVWPVLLLCALRFVPSRVVLLGTVALAGASAALMWTLYERGADVSRLYYGTDTHASGLLVGAALALGQDAYVRRPMWRVGPVVTDVSGALALVALAWLCWWLGEWRALLYHGGFIFAALLTVVALIAAIRTDSRFARWMGVPPLRWIGLRSYSIYLWHWPVLVFLRGHFGDAGLLLTALPATCLLAEASYRYVERPVRTRGVERLWGRMRRSTWQSWELPAGVAAGTAAGTTLGVVLAIAVMAPAPVRPGYLAQMPPAALPAAALPAPSTATAAYDALPLEEWGAERAAAVASVSAGRRATVPLLGDGTPVPDATARAFVSSSFALPNDPNERAAVHRDGAPLDVRALAVGDSILLGAAPQLAAAFTDIEIDAAVGRSVGAVLQVLRERRDGGRLSDVVIVHTGANGLFTRPQFDEMLSILRDVRVVIVVNDRVPQPWEGPNNAMMADAARRYAKVRLVDWHAASDGSPDLFWTDAVHVRPAGAALYADLLVAAIRG